MTILIDDHFIDDLRTACDMNRISREAFGEISVTAEELFGRELQERSTPVWVEEDGWMDVKERRKELLLEIAAHLVRGKITEEQFWNLVSHLPEATESAYLTAESKLMLRQGDGNRGTPPIWVKPDGTEEQGPALLIAEAAGFIRREVPTLRMPESRRPSRRTGCLGTALLFVCVPTLLIVLYVTLAVK